MEENQIDTRRRLPSENERRRELRHTTTQKKTHRGTGRRRETANNEKYQHTKKKTKRRKRNGGIEKRRNLVVSPRVAAASILDSFFFCVGPSLSLLPILTRGKNVLFWFGLFATTSLRLMFTHEHEHSVVLCGGPSLTSFHIRKTRTFRLSSSLSLTLRTIYPVFQFNLLPSSRDC